MDDTDRHNCNIDMFTNHPISISHWKSKIATGFHKQLFGDTMWQNWYKLDFHGAKQNSQPPLFFTPQEPATKFRTTLAQVARCLHV